MRGSLEDALVALDDQFQNGAFDDAALMGALAAMATLTGSRRGQLIGFSAAGVHFNWVTHTDPSMFAEIEAVGGNDLRVNSRLRVGLAAPTMRIVDERDFDTAGDRARHRAYDDFLERWDAPSVCGVTVLREDGLQVGLALNRGRRDTVVDDAMLRLFAQSARAARAAVRLRSRLVDRAAEVAAGVLDQLDVAGAVVTCDGRVLGMSRTAEAMASAGDILCVSAGRLSARTQPVDALAQALASAEPCLADVVLRDREGTPTAVAEVHRLPLNRSPVGAGESRLVIVRGGRTAQVDAAHRASAALFGFTCAEAAVARELLAGHSPAAIAARLQVGVGTVRTHVRALYEKAGADSQVSFLAVMNRQK